MEEELKKDYARRCLLPVSQLEPNTGQIEGVPVNPRQWTRAQLDKLKRSIQDTPQLLCERRILCAPHAGRYVILGGNMRYAALCELGADAVPVAIYDGLTVDEMRRIVLKDNGSFGAWDYDELANEWHDLPLLDFGVPSWPDLPAAEPKKSGSAELFGVAVTCETYEEQQKLYARLLADGYDCKTKSK